MKTAGDVIGTPAWQLDLMADEDATRRWNDQNRDPHPAISQLQLSLETLFSAESRIGNAADLLEGIPAEDKALSIIADLNDIEFAIRSLIKELGGKA